MITSSTVLAVFLLSMPLLVAAYYVIVVMVGLRRFGHHVGYLYRPDHDQALVVPFYVCAAAGVWLSSVQVPLTFRRVFLLGLPAGFLLYCLENAVWSRWAGASLERGTVDLRWALPALVVPFAEEVIYRGGYLLFRDFVGVVGYVALSSIAFALVHGFEGRRELVAKSVDGVLYAVLTVTTGSIVPAVFVHFGFNLGYVLWAVDDAGGLAKAVVGRGDSP